MDSKLYNNEKSPTGPLGWGTLMRLMWADLAFQRILHFINGNHLFLERVSAGLWRLNGFDDFGERLTVVLRFQGCNYLFCHDCVCLRQSVLRYSSY